VGDVSSGRRFDILKRDDFTCRYCGKRAGEAVLHVDHIVPRSHGGTDLPHNLATACSECNAGKAGKLIDSASPPGWQGLVGKTFRWSDGEGVIVSEQGHGYYVVEYLTPPERRGHRIVHLSTMHQQDWLLGASMVRLPEAIAAARLAKQRPVTAPRDGGSLERILLRLREGPCTVVALRQATGLSQGQLSLLLNALEATGRASRTREGQADVWRLVEPVGGEDDATTA
jgi:hypothetical protein